jgi:hypothetical protein
MILERLSFDDAARVEQVLTRGALAGLAAAFATLLVKVLLGPVAAGPIALALGAALLVLLVPRLSGVLLAALLFGAAAVAALARSWQVPWVFTLCLGVLLACEATTWPRRALALVAPTVAGAWALWVIEALSRRHLGAVGEGLRLAALASPALFVAVGAVLSQLSVTVDPVEHSLAPKPKARAAWMRVRAALKRLPKGPARERLERVCLEGAQRVVAASADERAAGAAVDRTAQAEAREAVKALDERMEETKDVELLGHLRQLARVHGDTLEQLSGLERRQARAEAQAAAAVGWLDTAAFSLELAPRDEAALLDLASRLLSLSAVKEVSPGLSEPVEDRPAKRPVPAAVGPSSTSSDRPDGLFHRL